MIKVNRVPVAPITYDNKLTLRDKELAVLTTLVKKGVDAFRQDAARFQADRYGPQRVSILATLPAVAWESVPDPTQSIDYHTFEIGANRCYDDNTVTDILNALRL